jgi:hypothetical protein
MMSKMAIRSEIRTLKGAIFVTLVILFCVMSWLCYVRSNENRIYSISNEGNSIELGMKYDSKTLSKGMKEEISSRISEKCSGIFKGDMIFAHINIDGDFHESYFVSDSIVFGYHKYEFLKDQRDSLSFKIGDKSFITQHVHSRVYKYEWSGVLCFVKCRGGADDSRKFFDVTFFIKEYLSDGYEDRSCLTD